MLIAIMMILGCCILSSIVIAVAQPTYEITLNPSDPAPLSDVTFTAEVSSDDPISEVYLIVKECRDDLCYTPGFNESMSEITSGQYEKEIKLIHSDANNIEYWLVVNSNGTWYDFQTDYEQKELKEVSNGNGGSNDTPGFELISLLVAVSLGVLLFKRKRVR